MALTGKKVLIVGASGFIGGRLAECFSKNYGILVHALVHRPGTAGAARIASLNNVKIYSGDMLNQASILAAAQGCQYIVHCAMGNQGSIQEQKEATLQGTRNVMGAARQCGIERTVYLSTASVHSLKGKHKEIQEDDPLDENFPYAIMKNDAEKIVRHEINEHNLSAVILRPTCVWGPFSPMWTINPGELIRQKIPFLPREGKGIANIVYIDNLVDAVYLSLSRQEALGHVFLINDTAALTWMDLYGGYADYFGLPRAVLCLHDEQSGVSRNIIGKMIKALKITVGKSLTARALWQRLPRSVQTNIRMRISLEESMQNLYSAECRYASEKAQHILGWKSRVSFIEGLKKTTQFLDYYFGY